MEEKILSITTKKTFSRKRYNWSNLELIQNVQAGKPSPFTKSSRRAGQHRDERGEGGFSGIVGESYLRERRASRFAVRGTRTSETF